MNEKLMKYAKVLQEAKLTDDVGDELDLVLGGIFNANHKFLKKMERLLDDMDEKKSDKRPTRSAGGGGFLEMIHPLTKVHLSRVYADAEVRFSRLTQAPNFNLLGPTMAGYNINAWGTDPQKDKQVVKLLFNEIAELAYTSGIQSTAERAEVSLALLESFGGERPWGGGGGGGMDFLLPMALLNGGGGVFSLGSLFGGGTLPTLTLPFPTA